jgi:hypothetical protein
MTFTVYPEDGMLALWDAAPFAHIEDYEAWEAELGDPARHVESGALVLIPVEDGERGCEVDVRVGGDGPGEPVSGPHLFVVTSDVQLSGPHAVGGVPWDNTAEPDVPAGRYAVTAHRDGGVLVLLLRDVGGH